MVDINPFAITRSTLQGDEGRHPLILTLDQHGTPLRWINWRHACFYHARNLVAWSAGTHSFTLFGGISQRTGQRSSISTNSIIAIKGCAPSSVGQTAVPALTNQELFRRDRHLCAYCGLNLPTHSLTRDHIIPVSRGGRDLWMNVVTACLPCNQHKSGRTPEEARMELLYAPFVPSKAEYLVLCNRQILSDQMEFLIRHLPRRSRLLPA